MAYNVLTMSTKKKCAVCSRQARRQCPAFDGFICTAWGLSDGKQAKRAHYGLIKNRFRELRDGTISWSDIMREDWGAGVWGEEVLEDGLSLSRVCGYS